MIQIKFDSQRRWYCIMAEWVRSGFLAFSVGAWEGEKVLQQYLLELARAQSVKGPLDAQGPCPL